MQPVRGSAMHPVNPKSAFYPLLKQRPTALIRNGIIGDGQGPGAQGLYQVDDRIYTTTKMFIRDGYMYPRQPGQTMDPRYPYELHEFPDETGATGLQLVTTPKVHISGEYLAQSSGIGSGGGGGGGGISSEYVASQMGMGSMSRNASLTRRDARKAAAEINLANQVYWLQKQRVRSRSNSLGQRVLNCAGGTVAPSVDSCDPPTTPSTTLDRTYIRNVDDLLLSLRQREQNQVPPSESGYSTASNRRRKKVSYQYNKYEVKPTEA